ncbi:hypothetical protein FE633_39060 [Streptomyces montanus]|uniref:Lipoprotein n=1 Tax=Streptomyces montanus TaxID=2580423 RepID=A0A5R9FH31_9ACTN|nr:hypothetical protein [Streptomyces montanus]TLS40928.1 hypothetical protein FE633_39060 [Streptomyces montanus]
MTTGKAPWPGAAFGSRLGLVLLTGALTAGCGQSDSKDAAASKQDTARTGSVSPSPQATPPEDLCTRIVAHWSRRVLDDDTYGDYQSMGLSNGQYEILMDVVDAARTEKEREGARAAERLIDRRARAGCEDWYREGGPSGGPWQ